MAGRGMPPPPLGGAPAWYQGSAPRGEFVLVVEGAQPAEAESVSPEDGLALVERYRAEGLSLRDAARRAAEETGLPRKELYDRALGKNGKE